MNPHDNDPRRHDRESGETASKEDLLAALGENGLQRVVELNTEDNPNRAEQTYPTLIKEIEETKRKMFREQGVDVDDDEKDDDPFAPEEPRPILEQWMTGEPEVGACESFLLKTLKEVDERRREKGGRRGYGTLYGEDTELINDESVADKLVENIDIIENKQYVIDQLRGFGYDVQIIGHMAKLNEAGIEIDDIEEYCRQLLSPELYYKEIAYAMAASMNALRERGVDMDDVVRTIVKKGDVRCLKDCLGDFFFENWGQLDPVEAQKSVKRRLEMLFQNAETKEYKEDVAYYVTEDINAAWGMVHYGVPLEELQDIFQRYDVDTESLTSVYQEVEAHMKAQKEEDQ